jgi:hypothetical protein
MVHRRLRVEPTAHGFDIFLPEVVVEHEIAKTRMTFKVHAEQIFGLALVPVCRVNPFDDAGERVFRERRAHQHVNPAGFAFAVKRVAQLPLARAFLDDQAGETEIPLLENTTVHIGEHATGARHFVPGVCGIEAALRFSGPAAFDMFLQFGAVHGRFTVPTPRRPTLGDHAAAWERKRRARAPERPPVSAPAGK